MVQKASRRCMGEMVMTPEHQSVLEYRVNVLESVVGEVKNAVKSIDTSLQTLARLEVHHAETRDGLERAFTDLGDHEARMRVIEVEMPTVKLIRNWVIGGVLSSVGMIGAAVFGVLMDVLAWI